MQVGREEGGRPPEGEAALGGGAGGRVPEDPRCLGPAGSHQPGAAQEGAVSQPWAVCSDLPDPHSTQLILASLLPRRGRDRPGGQMAGITDDHHTVHC